MVFVQSMQWLLFQPKNFLPHLPFPPQLLLHHHHHPVTVETMHTARGRRHAAAFLNLWTYASCTVAANMKMLFAVVIVHTAVRVTIPYVTLKRAYV